MSRSKIVLVCVLAALIVGTAFVVVPALAQHPDPVTQPANLGSSMRLQYLHEKLEIPMDKLEAMSLEEVNQLIKDNAAKLGVVVYENSRDAAGNEHPVKVAGDKVTKPSTSSDK